jgi:predicted DNA-binding transcriptional regulator AlpA
MSVFTYTQICLLNDNQIAKTLGVAVATVRRWRLHGRGPRFIKCGAAVRYDQRDFQQWLATRPAGGERNQEGRR